MSEETQSESLATENKGRNKGWDNLRPWQPGQSGNPGGRPKKKLIDEALAELLEAQDSAEAGELAKVLLAKAKDGDVRAAQLIAERTQGKPNQKVELTGKDGGAIDTTLRVEFVDGKS
jgi:hypothetical protein